MNGGAAAALIVLIVAVPSRHAAADAGQGTGAPLVAHVAEPGAAASVWIAGRLGIAQAPYSSDAFPELRSDAGQARHVRLGAALPILPHTWTGITVAASLSHIEQPAGAYRSATAWSNLLLFVEQHWSSPPRGPTSHHELRGRLTLGAPLATSGGRDDQRAQRALSVADALEGWTESESFTAEVLPVVASGTFLWYGPRYRVDLMLELPALVRISRRSVPEGARPQRVSLVPNVELRATYRPFAWLGVSGGATLAWRSAAVRTDDSSAPPQLMLTPRLLLNAGDHVLVVTDFAVAVRGPLSGTASFGVGLRGVL